MQHVATYGLAAMALALAIGVPTRSAAQELVASGFTQESFALLKQRAEAGDAKAKELYQKFLASTNALGEAISNYVNARDAHVTSPSKTDRAEKEGVLENYADALGALNTAKAEIQKAEASTGILTESMLKEAADSLVVNGFFVGMPLADAQARLVRLFPGRKVSRRPPGGNLAPTKQRGLEGLWIDGSNEAFCLAENDRVVRLLIPGSLVVNWMGLHSSSYEGRAAEIARKFGYVDVYGIPIVEFMFFNIPGIGGFASMDIAEYLIPVPTIDERELKKSGYGKGHALQFKQRLYRLGKEGRVTYFGESSGSSDVGSTNQDRNSFFESWLKNIRALGENASEGTLRIDAPNYKSPEGNRGKTADDSPRQQEAEAAGADDAKEGAKESVGGVFEGTSRPKGALPGLFGVKFGLTMPAGQSCETNNLFSLAYAYVPEKAFNEFTDYVIFASPKTRTIYQVRGIHHCGTRMEAQAKSAEVAPILEMKFGRRLQRDGGSQVMRFPGGDRLDVSIVQRDKGYSVLIDAVSSAYDIRNTEESMALKAEVAQSLVAPLGKTLDEVLSPLAARPANERGDYLAPLPGVLKANGFNDMALRLLPNTKRVGALYATASGDAISCAGIFDRTKSHLQLVFGPVAREGLVGNVDFTVDVSGASYRFALVRSAAGNLVTLGIEDINAGKAEAKKAAASDLDAL